MATTVYMDAPTGPLAAGAWDERLAGDSFYSSSRWLAFCSSEHHQPTGAVVDEGPGGETSAAPIARVMDPPRPLYRWTEILRAARLPLLPAAGIVVGPLQGYQTTLLHSSPDDPVASTSRMLAALRRRRSGDEALVALYADTTSVSQLRAAGAEAHPVLLEPDAWFELPPGGWEGWLDSFPSRRRRKLLAESRAFENAGYTMEHRPFSEVYRELGPLAQSTLSKYGSDAEAGAHVEVMRRHAEAMGEEARAVVCRLGGEPVGFCLFFIWNGISFLRWAGFDYPRLRGCGEYVNVVYYAQIKLAQELGVTRLHAGIKSCEIKALRGARLRPLWLLDLTEDSGHITAQSEICAHNRHRLEELRADPRTASAFEADETWLAWC